MFCLCGSTAFSEIKGQLLILRNLYKICGELYAKLFGYLFEILRFLLPVSTHNKISFLIMFQDSPLTQFRQLIYNRLI